MNEKGNFKLKFFSNHRELGPFVWPELNGVTREWAEAVTLGVCIGMRAKYKHPRVELYQVTDEGETLIREQR